VYFDILELCAVGIKVFGFCGGSVKKSGVFVGAEFLEAMVFWRLETLWTGHSSFMRIDLFFIISVKQSSI
jgi:hypothetical protein